MSDSTIGLPELIQQLKNDGINAGKVNGDKILEESKKHGKKIINEAKKEAELIIKLANEEHATKKSHMESELKMSARDFLLKFKNELKKKIIRPYIKDKLKNFVNDEFIKNCLKDLVILYAKSNDEKIDIIISSKIKKILVDFFKSDLSEKINNGYVPNLITEKNLSGFKLKISGKNFIWDFSIESILREISSLIEPNLSSFLIGEKDKDLKLDIKK